MSETPRLSPSIAHKLTTECPLSAWASHRLLGGLRKPPTASQVNGRLWHAAILEGGKDIEVIDVDSFRSTDAKTLRDAALEKGLIPVTRAAFEEMGPAVARIHESLWGLGIDLRQGEKEKRIEWTEYTEDGDAVECSGVLDHLNGLHIRDIKSSNSMVPLREASRRTADLHSMIQDAAYRSAVASEYDEDIERTTMDFLFIQTEPPFAVTPAPMSSTFSEISKLRWRRAVETWHRCLSQGTEQKNWPGPNDGFEPMEPPVWVVNQEMELEALRDE